MVTNTEPGAMTQTVEAMLDELHPLTGERAVLAQMARQLAAILDGMEASVAARMAGQTHGQLLKVLDKLGAQRREVGPTVDAAPPPSTPPTPPTPSKPYTDEHWYLGFEDNLYAGKLTSIIRKDAIRAGLPMPGTLAYARNPWAVNPWSWVREQKERGGPNRGRTGIAGDS